MKKNKNDKVQKVYKNKPVSINKSQIFLSVFAIVIGIVTLIGASYAVFRVSSSSERKNVLSTGSFQVNFQAGEVINIKNMGPMSTSEGKNTTPFTFTLTNAGTMDAMYKVFLEENSSDVNTVPSTDYLMISYKIDDGEYSVPISIKNLYNSNTLVLNKKLEAGKSRTYSIKIWLAQNATNEYQKTTFSAKVGVESSQITYDIAKDTIEDNTITLSNTIDNTLLNYRIYGNTVNGSSVGDKVEEGKYKISFLSTGNSTTKAGDIYLSEPLRKADENHVDYIDFESLEVVRYTKEENNMVVALPSATRKKISMPYMYTYLTSTEITVNTTVSPSKMELEYFKDE